MTLVSSCHRFKNFDSVQELAGICIGMITHIYRSTKSGSLLPPPSLQPHTPYWRAAEYKLQSSELHVGTNRNRSEKGSEAF